MCRRGIRNDIHVNISLDNYLLQDYSQALLPLFSRNLKAALGASQEPLHPESAIK